MMLLINSATVLDGLIDLLFQLGSFLHRIE